MKADLKVACCSLDSKICLALFLNSSALSEGFVWARRMLWVFSTGYSSKIVCTFEVACKVGLNAFPSVNTCQARQVELCCNDDA